MFNDKELVAAVRGLGLNKSQFVVCGSGVLVVHGIIPFARDIDILAFGDAWMQVSTGRNARKAPLGDNVVSFRDGQMEVYDGWTSAGWRVQDIVFEADLIDGIRYIRLERILEYKRRMHHEKDLAEIKLIEDFLAERRATKLGEEGQQINDQSNSTSEGTKL